jgi:predicted O-linked N-acetylglucosamine transferase (SPINDLY family)
MVQATELLKAGRLDESWAICAQVLAGNKDNVDALYAMGWIAFCKQDPDTALVLFRRVIELNPKHARAHNNIATILMNAGKAAGAGKHLEAAIEAAPDFTEAYVNLGAVRMTQGDPDAARTLFEKAGKLRPEDPAILNNLATVKMQLGEVDEAIAEFERVVSLKPNFAEAHNNLAQALRRKGRMAEALESLERGLAARPDYADAHSNLGNVLRDLGRLDEAVVSYRKALALKPDLTITHNNLIYTLKFMAETSSSEIKAAADRFGDVVRSRAEPFADWNVRRDPAKRLRVGMVSGDFRTHVVGRYLESFLGHIDRSRVELAAYNTSNTEDETTARLKPRFALWHKVGELDDGSLAGLIHEDAVDILIDLAGHTTGNRLPMFAYKPAPVQATWLGLFATTGVPGMDYIIADPYLVPDDEAQYFTEEVWPLAEIWFCLSPPHVAPEPGPPPALANGTVTFGCFNHLDKMTDVVVALWARVLLAVPGSRLLLKTRQLRDNIARQNTLARFAVHGIGPERLMLEESSPPADYFTAYNRVDVALDPFPYHGATTTLDGLWMAVPILTRRGDRVGAHLGESIAQAAGLADWIADDDDGYVAIAVNMTSDLRRLAELRAGQRERVLTSPLYDGARFARHFEEALRGMWQKACNQ